MTVLRYHEFIRDTLGKKGREEIDCQGRLWRELIVFYLDNPRRIINLYLLLR